MCLYHGVTLSFHRNSSSPATLLDLVFAWRIEVASWTTNVYGSKRVKGADISYTRDIPDQRASYERFKLRIPECRSAMTRVVGLGSFILYCAFLFCRSITFRRDAGARLQGRYCGLQFADANLEESCRIEF